MTIAPPPPPSPPPPSPPPPSPRAGSLVGRAWSGLAAAGAPAFRLWLARRAAAGKEIPARLPERWGQDATPRPAGRLLWLHGASLGEAVSALPLLQALPETVFTLFTTGTVTSARLLAQRLPELGLSHRVAHRFIPLDVPGWAARFLDHWRPDAACFLESELWPNLLSACQARGIPLALVNGRLSVRSAGSWLHAPGFARSVMGGFAWIEAQTEGDARRFMSLGARDATCSGNLKFAADKLPVDPAELARLSALLGDRPRWVAASTHPGDEALAAAVHHALAPGFPGLVTAIVPRHPERGAAIAAALATSGPAAGPAARPAAGQMTGSAAGQLAGQMTGPAAVPVARRSLGQDPPDGGLYLADTLGELGLIYRLFPTVFMGKSLAATDPPHRAGPNGAPNGAPKGATSGRPSGGPSGGHRGGQGGGQNPLEPARLGCAVATGPLVANFAEVVAALRAQDAIAVVADQAALAAWLAAMLADPAARAAMGARAQAAAGAADTLPAHLAARLVALLGA